MEIIIPFSWRLPDVFVRSPDGVLHRVVRHATTTETIAKLESIPSNTHLDCECMLDNGEALSWIGGNLYRQVNGGTIFTAEPGSAPVVADARKNAKARNTLRDAYRPQPARHPPAVSKNVVPSAVASLKTGNDWSLIRAWREHLNISTADMGLPAWEWITPSTSNWNGLARGPARSSWIAFRKPWESRPTSSMMHR